jgi:hypothetical protein
VARLFAVTRSRGAGWDPSRPLEGQAGWRAHADFMNALQSEGFVVLGGPLEGTPDTLLIIRAATPDEIRSRLAVDCWSRNGLLSISRIDPWQLRLGSLP